MKYVWFVGQWKGNEFEMQGIFSSEEKAKEACIKEYYFYVRFTLDELLPDETVNNFDNNPFCYPSLEKTQNK